MDTTVTFLIIHPSQSLGALLLEQARAMDKAFSDVRFECTYDISSAAFKQYDIVLCNVGNVKRRICRQLATPTNALKMMRATMPQTSVLIAISADPSNRKVANEGHAEFFILSGDLTPDINETFPHLLRLCMGIVRNRKTAEKARRERE